MAALQGVDIDEKIDEQIDERVATVEEIQARAMAKLSGDRNLIGAANQGITPEMGVQYAIAEGTELG